MSEQFLNDCNFENENKKYLLTLLKEVIINGKITKMMEVEYLLDKVYSLEIRDPKLNLLLVYTYFVILTKEQKLFFPKTKAYVIQILSEQITLYTDPTTVSGIYFNEYKEAFIEEKYLHLLTSEIFCKYVNKDFSLMGVEKIPEDKINILVNSLFTTNFCKFNDAFLYAFMIWKGVYNYDYTNISEYTKDLLDLLLQNQIHGLLNNLIEDNSEQTPYNFEEQFYEMRIQE